MPFRSTTHLAFRDHAEDAVEFYVSLLPGRIISTALAGENDPGETGSVATIHFELLGQDFLAVNGGEEFSFTEGYSIYVNCDTQSEIDRLWSALADGGSTAPCGWVTDRFGLSWQVAPAVVIRILDEADEATIGRVNRVIYDSTKLDIHAILDAAGPGPWNEK